MSKVHLIFAFIRHTRQQRPALYKRCQKILTEKS